MAATPVIANIAATNTIFSLIGSTMAAFVLSCFLNQGKFNIEHLLGASISGGVVVAACANLILHAYLAYIFGILIGLGTVLMMVYLNPLLIWIKLLDVSGVLYCFAIPGIFGGILSAILRASYFSNGIL